MKLRHSLSVLIAGIVYLGGAQAGRAQLTGQVYQVSMSGSFVQSQTVNSNQEVVVKGSFISENIINVARGRSPDATVPANEKLALVVVFVDSGDPICELIVYDSNTQSNLTTICEMDLGGAIDSAKGKGAIAMAGSIDNVGGFTKGWIAMAGKSTITGMDTTAPQIAFSGAIQALLRGNDGEDFELVVTKGKARLLGTIGTLLIAP